jgi:hypothetical protein
LAIFNVPWLATTFVYAHLKYVVSHPIGVIRPSYMNSDFEIVGES